MARKREFAGQPVPTIIRHELPLLAGPAQVYLRHADRWRTEP